MFSTTNQLGIKKQNINKKKKENKNSKCRSESQNSPNVLKTVFQISGLCLDSRRWILFTLIHSEINGNDNFYSSNVELTANDVKFKIKNKFEDKSLVYVIICPHGISEPFITPFGLAFNEVNFTDDCLAKK